MCVCVPLFRPRPGYHENGIMDDITAGHVTSIQDSDSYYKYLGSVCVCVCVFAYKINSKYDILPPYGPTSKSFLFYVTKIITLSLF